MSINAEDERLDSSNPHESTPEESKEMNNEFEEGMISAEQMLEELEQIRKEYYR